MHLACEDNLICYTDFFFPLIFRTAWSPIILFKLLSEIALDSWISPRFTCNCLGSLLFNSLEIPFSRTKWQSVFMRKKRQAGSATKAGSVSINTGLLPFSWACLQRGMLLSQQITQCHRGFRFPIGNCQSTDSCTEFIFSQWHIILEWQIAGRYLGLCHKFWQKLQQLWVAWA